MTVYLIAKIDLKDRETYAKYEAGFGEIFAKYNGQMLAVEESPEVLEGEWPHWRTVLIQFPSREDALAWYRSDEYQALAQFRFEASSADTVILQGLTKSFDQN